MEKKSKLKPSYLSRITNALLKEIIEKKSHTGKKYSAAVLIPTLPDGTEGKELILRVQEGSTKEFFVEKIGQKIDAVIAGKPYLGDDGITRLDRELTKIRAPWLKPGHTQVFFFVRNHYSARSFPYKEGLRYVVHGVLLCRGNHDKNKKETKWPNLCVSAFSDSKIEVEDGGAVVRVVFDGFTTIKTDEKTKNTVINGNILEMKVFSRHRKE